MSGGTFCIQNRVASADTSWFANDDRAALATAKKEGFDFEKRTRNGFEPWAATFAGVGPGRRICLCKQSDGARMVQGVIKILDRTPARPPSLAAKLQRRPTLARSSATFAVAYGARCISATLTERCTRPTQQTTGRFPLPSCFRSMPTTRSARWIICHAHGTPVTPRGGGTSLTGASCNASVIFDYSKYMHRYHRAGSH